MIELDHDAAERGRLFAESYGMTILSIDNVTKITVDKAAEYHLKTLRDFWLVRMRRAFVPCDYNESLSQEEREITDAYMWEHDTVIVVVEADGSTRFE